MRFNNIAKNLLRTSIGSGIGPLDALELERDTWFKSSSVQNVKKFRDYADGKHVRILTEDQKIVLEGMLDNEFCDNVCHQIIAEASDRLALLRFDVDDEEVKKALSVFWTQCHVADVANETHYNALRDGNYCILVGWDNLKQRITLTREPWWDGESGVYIHYDAVGNPMWALKQWFTRDGIRRLVWYEDHVERYLSNAGLNSFVPFANEKVSSSEEWTKLDGSPLHIPFIHFPNSGRGARNYGLSELSGGVLGFQDQLNDLQYDMSAVGRNTGFQQLAFFGVAANEEYIASPGNVYTAESSDAHGMVLPAGNAQPLIDLYNQKLRSISRMTRTPYHMIGGDWPSGEALLRAELPAINKAATQITKFSTSWATVAHRAIEISNAFGRAGLNEDAMIRAVFDSPERRDLLSKSFVLRNVSQWTGFRQAQETLGYTPEQAEANWTRYQEEQKILAEIKAEAVPDPGQMDDNNNEGGPGNKTNSDNPKNTSKVNTGTSSQPQRPRS